MTEVLSTAPVSTEYLERLRADLDDAQIVRFAVAFISGAGVSAIGADRLVRALTSPESFGLSTLHCGCGFEPLMDLQKALGSWCPRLRYFMDPCYKGRREVEPTLALLHSKLVFIVSKDGRRAVTYVGSHNWSQRALADGPTRNAEVSLRVEEPFQPDQLYGRGDSVAAKVNAHLLTLNNYPVWEDADPSNRAVFEEWRDAACDRGSIGEPLEQVAVVCCVGRNAYGLADAATWDALRRGGVGLYLQLLDEQEGSVVWEQSGRVRLLVWPTRADLDAGRSPIVVFCHSTQRGAGKESMLQGTSHPVMQGFRGVLLDGQQHARWQAGRNIGPPQEATVRGVARVRFFDLDLTPKERSSTEIDGEREPLYGHYLQVVQVVFPAWIAERESLRGELVYEPGTVAFSTRKGVPAERVPGFQAQEGRRIAIDEALDSVFGVPPGEGRSRAFADRPPREGLRISDHPLHDAMADVQERARGDEVYRSHERGALVPELDLARVRREEREEPIARVQALYMEALDVLLKRFRGGG
jgi:hypothetical protein